MMPSPSDLQYFIEVVNTGNLSRAAERIGITQPSITLSMQRLEHSVGTPLLIRSKKGVTPTQAGKQILARARDLLQQWEQIRGQALSSMNEVQGNYVIGCHPAVAFYTTPHFIPDMIEKNPKLEIRMVHDLSRKIAERVINMEVDVGIVVNPVKHPDLVIKKLCDDQVTFWVGKGHRKTQDYKTGTAVLISDPDLLQTQDLTKQLKRSQIHYGRTLTTSSLEVITELVAGGAGIGVIPGRVVKQVNAKLHPIPGAPVFHDEICLIYRVENKNVESIQTIARYVTEMFGA